MRRRPLTRFAGAFLATSLALTACGGGEDTADTGTGTGDQATGANVARFCDANIAVEKGFNKLFSEGGPEGEGPPTPEQTKKIQESIDKEVIPHVERVEANAPDEIQDEVKTAVASVRKFRADPGYDFNEDPEAVAAVQKLDGYFYDNCDVEKATVQAVDYDFRGVPADIKSGEDLVVRIDNQGKEVHEFVVLGKRQGVTESWDDLLKLEPPEAEKKTRFIGVSFAPPGKQDVGVFTFDQPGDYIAVCFIPQGTTSPEQLGGPDGGEEGPAGTSSPSATSSPAATPTPGGTASPGQAGPGGEGEGGPPHFTLGMRKELKVT